MEVMTYNYVTIRLGPGITMNLLYGPMIKYRISLLLELVGFVTGPDVIYTNRSTMSVFTRRLNILIETGRAYKLGTFEDWHQAKGVDPKRFEIRGCILKLTQIS